MSTLQLTPTIVEKLRVFLFKKEIRHEGLNGKIIEPKNCIGIRWNWHRISRIVGGLLDSVSNLLENVE